MESKGCLKNESDSMYKPNSRESSLINDSYDRKRTNRSPIRSNSKEREWEELPSKKPRLLVDTSVNCQPLCEALSSNESFISGADNDMTPVPSGLSVYLEDIISDEEPLEETTPPRPKTPPPPPPIISSTSSSKEELLQLMEKVDREITSIEQQISVLEKRQEETQNQLTTPSSSETTPPSSAVVTSSFISSSDHTPSSSAPSSSSHHSVHVTPTSAVVVTTVQPEAVHHMSVLETIYHENRLKAVNNRMILFGNNNNNSSLTPSYFQPCELPQIARNRQKHKVFFPKLVALLKKRKIAKHLKEVSLCEEYDRYSTEWERRLERWTQSTKKKHRDSRNKELFEKMFPELRSKRDQLRDEAYSRVGVRSFGVVRSEAELNQLAFELYEQDEAKGRCRLTHAVLPPMLIDDRERGVQFKNSNGLITDPMSIHRETKSVSNWSEEEKKLFKEKFTQFPKNFEKIASFLPHKSMNECVRYYYLVKKKEHFKQLIRRSSFKRRRLSKHQPNYHLNSSSTILGSHHVNKHSNKPHLSSSEGGHSSAPPSVLTSPTVTPSVSLNIIKSPTRLPEYDGWTEKEITSLKEGLCKYGRAWGKVYREVGGKKSATQCKQFYDTYCTDSHLQLNSALAEHSSKKNAEKVKKKMEEMKKPLPQAPPTATVTTTTRKIERKVTQLPVHHHREEEEEEEEESEESEGTDSEGSEEETDSETTLTDSGSEEQSSLRGGSGSTHIKPPLRLSIDSTHHSDSLQSPLDIFLSAAEALSNTVPVEIALHDHTYPRPPMDIQGSSGLQLIAAAAAVISPDLSKSSSPTNKVPFSNKAPRGRPPSQQKRGGSNYSQKLAPTFLTPTSGTSHNILLQDLKPSLRNRSRSAPTDKRPTVLPPHHHGNKALPYPPTHSIKSRISTPHHGSTTGYKTPVASKDINLIASLKSTATNGHHTNASSSNNTVTTSLDATTNILTGIHHTGLPSHERSSVHSPVLSYPLVNSTSASTVTSAKTNKKDGGGTVLELNLGNMALLLAATGTNQQAALLLPQSTLLNKQALAMLQSGSVCITTDSSATATINIDPSVLTTGSITSNSQRGSTVKNTPDIINKTINKITMTPQMTVTPHTTSNKDITVSNKSLSSTSTTPSSNDLTNLNLLSNLVAGLPKKSDAHHNSLATTQPSMTPVLTTPTIKPVTTRKIEDKNKDVVKVGVSHRSVATTTAAITSPYPTTTSSHQQSLMLYARSLTMPTSNPSQEDSLEYATRGISELTKLLGGSSSTDNGMDSAPPPPSSNKSSGQWSPDELLCNPFNEHGSTPTSVHTITSSLTATSAEFLVPPTHQLAISTRTPTPINALTDDTG